MKEDSEDTLKFYGRQGLAVLPIVLYVILSGVIMIATHCYSMKVLILAAIISILAGFIFCKNKIDFWNAVVRGLAKYGNARLILIFMVIGIFSKVLVIGDVSDFLLRRRQCRRNAL